MSSFDFGMYRIEKELVCHEWNEYLMHCSTHDRIEGDKITVLSDRNGNPLIKVQIYGILVKVGRYKTEKAKVYFKDNDESIITKTEPFKFTAIVENEGRMLFFNCKIYPRFRYILYAIGPGSVGLNQGTELIKEIDGGKFFTISPNHFLKIGRDTGNNIVFDCKKVSRFHCSLLERGELMLQDEGSTNGTVVNNVRIAGPIKLKNEDVIQFPPGTCECTIKVNIYN
ncbi:MAG: FHA domain-containing protein [Nanoarchaeota archaeon]|nr:FHA domain-containing protein [Nanoarchaeota archaeon]